MKQKSTYHVTLSNGKECDYVADSAGEAIEKAIQRWPGTTAVHCYAGVTEEDCAEIVAEDPTKKPLAGTVTFEIPRHDPAAPKPSEAEAADPTVPMFDENAIALESGRALARREMA